MAASADNFQGIFGKFQPVIDETVATTADNVQGLFGKFGPVLDDAAGATAGGPRGPLGQPIHGPLGGPA